MSENTASGRRRRILRYDCVIFGGISASSCSCYCCAKSKRGWMHESSEDREKDSQQQSDRGRRLVNVSLQGLHFSVWCLFLQPIFLKSLTFSISCQHFLRNEEDGEI